MSASPPTEFARLARLPPYVFSITSELRMAARRRGEDIVDFGMGNPDGPTPPHIVEKLVDTVRRPDTHGYSMSKGIPRLRRAICHWYADRYGVTLDPESEAIVTIGSKEGIGHIPLAFVNPGDVVLVPSPGYPVYPIGTLFAGGESFMMPLREENNFLPDLNRIPKGILKKAKLMFINYPNNPTGATASAAASSRR